MKTGYKKMQVKIEQCVFVLINYHKTSFQQVMERFSRRFSGRNAPTDRTTLIFKILLKNKLFMGWDVFGQIDLSILTITTRSLEISQQQQHQIINIIIKYLQETLLKLTQECVKVFESIFSIRNSHLLKIQNKVKIFGFFFVLTEDTN